MPTDVSMFTAQNATSAQAESHRSISPRMMRCGKGWIAVAVAVTAARRDGPYRYTRRMCDPTSAPARAASISPAPASSHAIIVITSRSCGFPIGPSSPCRRNGRTSRTPAGSPGPAAPSRRINGTARAETAIGEQVVADAGPVLLVSRRSRFPSASRRWCPTRSTTGRRAGCR
jgi:hypothetical protein